MPIVPSEPSPFATRLTDGRVLLRPMLPEDFDALFALGADPELWVMHRDHHRYTEEGFRRFFQQGLDNPLGCYVVELGDRGIVGSSRFYDYESEWRRVRLGYSFLGKAFWGTGLNAAVKKLLLDEAFHHVNQVFFDIYKENVRSRKAVLKLGARLLEERDDTLVFAIDREGWLAREKAVESARD